MDRLDNTSKKNSIFEFNNKDNVNIKITKEQRIIIDKLLKESDERQKMPGSRYYTLEESWGELMEQHNRYLQNNN